MFEDGSRYRSKGNGHLPLGNVQPDPVGRFASLVVEDPGDGRLGSVAGGPPVVEPALVATADLLVAVLRGGGEPASRIRLDAADSRRIPGRI